MSQYRKAHDSHRDAVRDVAKASGYHEIHDSGPCLDGRLVLFADEVGALDYLHGDGTLGHRARVQYNPAGEVEQASLRVDNEPRANVGGSRGNGGQRLLWTLQMFNDNRIGE